MHQQPEVENRAGENPAREEWLNSDGTATSHCLKARSFKLQHIEGSERSPTEQEDWTKVLEQSAKDARIRAVQLHFQLISNLKHALPLTIASPAGIRAPRVAVALPALCDDEYGRAWIYDTGCHAAAIGRAHLTAAERKRVFRCEPKVCITAAGPTSTSQAVKCYVPYLGKRRCYVLEDCPLPSP